MNSVSSARRCLLFVPGDSQRKLEKSAQLRVDCIIFDLEDSVAPGRKKAAREMVSKIIPSLNFKQTERLIRVNPPGSEFFTADMDTVASLDVEGIVLSKVETADHLLQAAQMTTLPILALIETALAVMNLREIAQATSQLTGLMFGAEDLMVNLGAVPSADKRELAYARSAVVMAAAAYGLQAIDSVFIDLQNTGGLTAETEAARRMGYTGKMAIHPNQVELIQRIFSPTGAEIEQATALVEAYQAHIKAGEGVFTINGRMIDRPVVGRAENLLERARLARLMDG